MQPVKGSSGTVRSGVEVVRRTRAVQVMLSLPSSRPVDRREVLDKARNILAREQARRESASRAADTAATREQHQAPPPSGPGCGAWWAF